MSSIINEMKAQLQLDLNGQQSAGVESNAFEEVMDKFIESKDFERALCYRGNERRARGEAKSSQSDQKTDLSGGSPLRSLNEILQGRHQMADGKQAGDQEDEDAALEGILDVDSLADDLIMPPRRKYEKSFLRNIPSIILEAHESIIS